MTAIIAGAGLGLEQSSARTLGARGLLGTTAQGRGGEQVYVNAATGNLIIQRGDEFLIGRGPDLSIARTYNSLGQFSDDNGDNWRQSTDRRIFGVTGTLNTAGSTVKRVSSDGSIVTYKWVADGLYQTDPDEDKRTGGVDRRDRLVYSGGQWTWTDGDAHITEVYGAGVGSDWRITERRDGDGNKITFDYTDLDPDPLIARTRIKTQYAHLPGYAEYVDYVWSGGNITSVTVGHDDLSTTETTIVTRTRTTYEYTSNRLTKVTVDLTPKDISDNVTYQTNYEYDAPGRVTAIWQTDGSRLEITYYAASDPEAIANPSIVGRVKHVKQRVAGSEYRITEFDYFSDRTEITDPAHYGQSNPPRTILYYNTDKQLTKIVAPDALQTVEFTYDAATGDLKTVTEVGSPNRVTTYDHTANGLVSRITDPNGNVAERTYDSANNLILEKRTGSYTGGSSASLYTRYVYDAENHLVYAVSAEGHVTEYVYDTPGQLIRRIEYTQDAYDVGSEPLTVGDLNTWRNGLDRSSVKICAYAYDVRGNLTAEIHYGGADSSGQPIQTEGYRHTTTVYDQAGLLLSRATAPDVGESFVHDGLGRLILSTNLAGGSTSIVFNDANTTTVVTSASGYATTSVYNKAGELIQAIRPADAVTNVTGGDRFYWYDKNGRVRIAQDATDRKTYVLYDNAGRKIADIGHQGELTEYRYDATGRVVATARYLNRLTSQQMADLNNLTLEIDIDAPNWRPVAHAQDIWQWSVYDQGGRIIETIMGDGSVAHYEYDNADRLIKTTGFHNKLSQNALDDFKDMPPTIPLTLPAADADHDRITRSFYDRDGRLIGALNAEGFLTQVVYDEAGQKIRETAFANATNLADRADGSFDTLLGSLADPAKDVTTRYVYDGQGLLRFTIDAIGRVTENIYWESDPWFWYANGRPRKVVSYANPLGSLPDYSYAAVKAAVAGPGFANAANDRASYAVYNLHGQLAYSVDAAGSVAGFAYDDEGRVTETTQYAALVDMDVEGAVFQHPWWLEQWTNNHGADARVTRNYYNKRGELGFRIDAEGYATQYEYNAESQLVAEHRWSAKLDLNTAWTVGTLLSPQTNKGTALTTTYGYDWSGRLSDVWDAAGTRRSKIYWATGTLGFEIVAYQQATDESRIQYTYDQAGKLISETRFTSEAANAWAVGAAKTQLNGGERLLSPNQQYSAVLTREGELRVYHWGEQVWTNGVRDTTAGATFRLVAESNGQLVIYRDVSGQSEPIWSDGGAYTGDAFLEMKNSGEFGLYKGTPGSSPGPVWTIQTASVPVSPYMQQWLVTSYAYDGLGNVAKVTDARGNATDFTHDKVGRVRTRTDALGGVTQFEYDAFGRSVKTVDARGNASFAYFDQMGRVTHTVDAENYVTHTDYTAFGEVEFVTRSYNRASGAVTLAAPPSVTVSSLDATTRMKYDKLGRVTLMVDAEHFVTKTVYTDFGEGASVKRFYLRTTDPAGLAEPATHALDATTTFQYDDLSRVTLTTDAEGASEIYVLDAYGNRTKTTNKIGGVSERTFDGVGRVVTETIWYTESQAAGAPKTVNRYVYDRRGNLIGKIENAEGPANKQRATTYEYDKQNRLVRTIGDAVEVTAGATSASTTSAPTERYFYDRNGNLAEKIDTVGAKTLFWYDKLNRLTHKLSPLGTLTTYVYDANGNATETRMYATAPVSPPANAAGAVPTPTASADDRVAHKVYDKLGRLIRSETPNIATAAYFVDFATTTQTLAVRYDYDAMGRIVRTTDANGAQTDSFYDRLGRKIIEIDAENYRTDWTYDSEGNVLTERRYATRVAFAERNLFRGGDLSQGTSVFHPDWDEGTGIYYATAIETIDNAAALTLRKNGGAVQSWGINGGSVVGRTGDRADGKWSVTAGETIGFAFETRQLYAEDPLTVFAHFVFYNAQGQAFNWAPLTTWDANDWQRASGVIVVPANAVAAELRFGSYRTDSDTNGRMDFAVRSIQVHRLEGGATAASIPAWNAAPALPTAAPITSPDDRVTIFTYDKMGRRRSETRTGVDVHNGSGGTVQQNATIRFEYNALGQVEKKFEATNADPVNADIVYEYDEQGRVIVEKRASFLDFNGQTVTPTTEYTYDALGNLTQTRALGKDGDGVAGFNPLLDTAERVTTYSYGAGGRLISMTDAEGFTRTYRYDAAGRVVREEYARIMPTGSAEEAIGHDYDLEGRIVQQGLLVRLATAGQAHEYVTDAQGRVVVQAGSVTKQAGDWTRSIIGSSGGETIDTALMFYNAFGEIAERGMNGVYAEKYLYDGAGRVWKTNAGDGTWKYFMHDAGGNQTLIVQSDGDDISGFGSIGVLIEAYWEGSHGDIETTDAGGVVATLTKYDARNRAIKVLDPRRELRSDGPEAERVTDLWTSRVYNAFGEVVQEANALGHDANGAMIDAASVKYVYNTMGRLIRTESPAVTITREAPETETLETLTNYRPTEHRYYDISGRLVATKDANGHLTRMTLLAGSGYGGAQALTTEVWTPDDAFVRTLYDIHGDARKIRGQLYVSTQPALPDHLNYVTAQTFDRMGRLVQVNKPGGLIGYSEYFAYDGLGQRIKRWNSHYGNDADTDVERTFYDAQGRVSQYHAMGGDFISYAYEWTTAAQAGPSGGWVQTSTYDISTDPAKDKKLSEWTDVFGRQRYKIDLGGHVSWFTYDEAGRLIARNGGGSVEYAHFNTGRVAEIEATELEAVTTPAPSPETRHSTFRRWARYGYDKAGRVVSESLTETDVIQRYFTIHESGVPDTYEWRDPVTNNYTLKTATAEYDALGRLTHWREAGSADTPFAEIFYKYDAAGNIRNSLATFQTLGAQGQISAGTTTQDYWYRFDAMNRVVRAKGAGVDTNLDGASDTIVRTYGTVDIAYDKAGQRAYTLTAFKDIFFGPFVNVRREEFVYDVAGRLFRIDSQAGTHAAPVPVDADVDSSDKRGEFYYDAMGRLTRQFDYAADGSLAFDRRIEYNPKGQVDVDESWTRRGETIYRALATYDYGEIDAFGTYRLGAAVSIETENWEGGSQKPTAKIINTYQWWDGPMQATTTFDPDKDTVGVTNTSTYVYRDLAGQTQLARVEIRDGRTRDAVFASDINGQALQREEEMSGDRPREIWHRFNGKLMGYVGNNGTPESDYSKGDATQNLEQDYASSIGNRTAQPGTGAFRNGSSTSVSFADFDQSISAITSYSQGSSFGSYAVRTGDTLASIAATLWGDSSLWYKLAEANGLSGASTLIEGQMLVIPTGVAKSTHNASTFTPYDPNEIIGETLPTAPRMPRKKQCAMFPQIVQVVVTAILSYYLGAVPGNILGQGWGMATGAQEDFSWNQVAIAAVAAIVTAGIGGGGDYGASAGAASGAGAAASGGASAAASTSATTASQIAGAFARAAAANAITQGVSYAFGWQEEFSWAGVAAAGVGAAAGAGVGRLVGARSLHVDPSLGNLGRNVLATTASAIADAATRSAIEGSDFDVNLRSATANAVGQMLADFFIGGAEAEPALTVRPLSITEEMSIDRLPELEGLTSPLMFSLDANDAAMAAGLPSGTAVATRADGTRIYSLPTRPGYVRGNEFRSWSFDGRGRVIIEAAEGFEFDSVIADGGVRMQFTNDVGQIADVAAWARPGETRVIAVPEISGSITFIGPPRQDPLSQFAAGAIRAYATGSNDLLQAGLFAFQHPIEAGKAVVNAGVNVWLSTANTVRMAMTDSGRAQLGNQIGAWANRTGSNIAWHVNNGTIYDGIGQIAGGIALAELTGGGLFRGPRPAAATSAAAVAAESTALRQTGSGSILGSADEAYDAIRASTTDVASIAGHTSYKASNIQKVKNHLFMDEHLLDRYESLGIPATRGRFDSDIGIAQAWQRLANGTHGPADLMLLRHETAEAWYMRNVSPGYNAAHNAAQRRFPAPGF